MNNLFLVSPKAQKLIGEDQENFEKIKSKQQKKHHHKHEKYSPASKVEVDKVNQCLDGLEVTLSDEELLRRFNEEMEG